LCGFSITCCNVGCSVTYSISDSHLYQNMHT
jgi:hypothetical protein